MADIYNDGTYLKNNPGWHQAEGRYKAGLVRRAIARSRTSFRSCVDVGCGAGEVAFLLAKSFPDRTFVGYDVSRDAARFWSARKLDNLGFRLGSFLESADSWDLALCLDVFEHVEDYMGFLRALAGRARRVIFNVPLDLNLAQLVGGGLRWAREATGHLHHFSPYTAIATLRDCGYAVVDEYLTAAFLSNRPSSLRQALMLLPRLLSCLLGSKVSSMLVGGYSAVVTADSRAMRPGGADGGTAGES